MPDSSNRSDSVVLKALFRRAKAHEGLGHVDKAMEDFRKCLELEPHNVDARDQAGNRKIKGCQRHT